MSQAKVEQPVFLIVVGPNGSGKSSSYRDTEIEQSGRTIWIVNPDAHRAHPASREGPNRGEPGCRGADRDLARTSMDVHKSVGVETVLSTGKYRRLVAKAKSLGFAIWFIYVILDTPERNVERVRLRVRKGGHHVPEDKMRARYTRSLAQLPWFLDQADEAWIYDNSGAQPRRIGDKKKGVVTLDEWALPVLVEAVRAIETE